jgi:uncharacterized protein YndB with AHSA1/START domain
MVAIATEEAIHTLNIVKERLIEAPVEITFEAILEELGPGGEMPDGKAFPMVLEAWPGGRWYRDLGSKTGHLWGHVQVIKPPGLLEICGPMFMSYAAINFVQYRLVAEGSGTLLKLTHGAIGQIPAEHREGVQMGWEHGLSQIEKIAKRLLGSRAKR